MDKCRFDCNHQQQTCPAENQTWFSWKQPSASLGPTTKVPDGSSIFDLLTLNNVESEQALDSSSVFRSAPLSPGRAASTTLEPQTFSGPPPITSACLVPAGSCRFLIIPAGSCSFLEVHGDQSERERRKEFLLDASLENSPSFCSP